jgi:hypothetical protein
MDILSASEQGVARQGNVMRLRRFCWLLTTLWVLAGDTSQAAAQERFVGVRRNSAGEIILFALDAAQGERKIATLQKEGVGIQLLGITALNARRGTFSYAFTDVPTGKDYLQTVNVLTGQTLGRIALPPDTTGLELVPDAPLLGGRWEKDAMVRKIEALEQEVKRLQSQARPR